MPKLWRGISGLRKQLDWLGMSSLVVGVVEDIWKGPQHDGNGNNNLPALLYIQAGIVASTGLPFNDIFAPIWASVLRWLRSSASSVDFCNNLLKKARNMFARRAHSIPLPFPCTLPEQFQLCLLAGNCLWRLSLRLAIKCCAKSMRFYATISNKSSLGPGPQTS